MWSLFPASPLSPSLTWLGSVLSPDHDRQVLPHSLCKVAPLPETLFPQVSAWLTSYLLGAFLKCHLLKEASWDIFNTVTSTPTLLIGPPPLYSFYLPRGTYHLLLLCLIYSVIMFLLCCLCPSVSKSIELHKRQGSLFSSKHFKKNLTYSRCSINF